MVEMCEVLLSHLKLRPALPLSKSLTCERSSAVEGVASESDLKASIYSDIHWFPLNVILPSAGYSRYNSPSSASSEVTALTSGHCAAIRLL